MIYFIQDNFDGSQYKVEGDFKKDILLKICEHFLNDSNNFQLFEDFINDALGAVVEVNSLPKL